jgi:hypothetical protein
MFCTLIDIKLSIGQKPFNKVAQTEKSIFLVFVRNVPTKGTARH